FGEDAWSPASVPRLALDYLVATGISVGTSLIVTSRAVNSGLLSGQRDGNGVDVILNPRVGYAYPFDETFGVWPRLGYNFSHEVSKGKAANGATQKSTLNLASLTIDAMAVLSPFKHFVIMGGPYLDLGLGGSYKLEDRDGKKLDSRNAKLTAFGLTF